MTADGKPGLHYLIGLWVDGPLDVEDERPIKEQADALIDYLIDIVLETAPGSIWAELLAVEEIPGRTR